MNCPKCGSPIELLRCVHCGFDLERDSFAFPYKLNDAENGSLFEHIILIREETIKYEKGKDEIKSIIDKLCLLENSLLEEKGNLLKLRKKYVKRDKMHRIGFEDAEKTITDRIESLEEIQKNVLIIRKKYFTHYNSAFPGTKEELIEYNKASEIIKNSSDYFDLKKRFESMEEITESKLAEDFPVFRVKKEETVLMNQKAPIFQIIMFQK